MKQLVLLAAMALTGLTAQAQNSETRKSADFTALEVKNGIEVIVTQGNDYSLKVESDTAQNMENIVTEFKMGVLKIYLKELNPTIPLALGKAKVYVSAKSLNSFKAITGSAITINGRLSANELDVTLETGSSFTGEVESLEKCRIKAKSGSMFRGIVKAEDFSANISGGASIKITGLAQFATIACNNGAMLGGKFICQKTDVRAVNGSTAFVNTMKSINANTDTTSSITYYGEPENVNLGENTYTIKRDNLKLALNN